MTNQLKPDEQFVINSLAAHVGGTWSTGENPPDAYLRIGEEAVAVEISTLTQHVVAERGGTRLIPSSGRRLAGESTGRRVW